MVCILYLQGTEEARKAKLRTLIQAGYIIFKEYGSPTYYHIYIKNLQQLLDIARVASCEPTICYFLTNEYGIEIKC